MRFWIAIIAAFFTTPAFASADHYEIDKSHTAVIFFIDHLGFCDMIGRFTDFNATLVFDRDMPKNSKLSVKINPKSVRTSSEALDGVLQNEHFFNSKQFPEIRFESTGIHVTGDDDGDVTGNLTMLGVTKPLTLHVHLNKAGYRPITNEFAAGFHAEATLKRSDFGMSYGIPMVGDEVRILIETEAVDLDRKKAEAIKH